MLKGDKLYIVPNSEVIVFDRWLVENSSFFVEDYDDAISFEEIDGEFIKMLTEEEFFLLQNP
jgi:hypothetical protein